MGMKYKTLADLKAAYDSGELNPEESPLTLDNDCSFVYKDSKCVYRGNGPDFLVGEALTLLGIPWDNV
jgi:hypothetical protein